MEEKIRENAELVIKMAAELGVELTYDEESVAWLDGYIERNRLEFGEETIFGLINIFGSFLGECIRHQFGGRWMQLEGTWAISFDERNHLFPFRKVSKQFEHGAEDSILSFFTMIPIVFKFLEKSRPPYKGTKKKKKGKGVKDKTRD